MQTYRYETRITKNGSINVPLSKKLFDKDVEIIILTKDKSVKSKLSPQEFLDKWSGFLAAVDDDKARYEYLMEKYK
jgi:hypothetical protein